MTDPRTHSNVGVDARYRTYKIDNSTITFSATENGGSAQVGLAVGLSSDDTVELVGDGEEVIGKLIKVESDNYCTVQVGGVMTLPGGDSATLTLGAAIVGDLGASSAEGYIRVSDGATAAEIIAQKGRILDNDTTTAVVVDFG